MKYFYVYKITNLINHKIYVGKRVSKVKPEDDIYYGSGKLILSAIEKYGLENFSKEILGIFESEDDAARHEKSIVDKEFIKREDTYNLHEGGYGGFGHIKWTGDNHPSKRPEARAAQSLRSRNRSPEVLEKIRAAAIKQNLSRSREEILPFIYSRLGKKASDETKEKMRKNHKDNSGDKHIFYGKKRPEHSEKLRGGRWMYNDSGVVTKVDKAKVDLYLNDGWNFGRKVKHDE